MTSTGNANNDQKLTRFSKFCGNSLSSVRDLIRSWVSSAFCVSSGAVGKQALSQVDINRGCTSITETKKYKHNI